MDMDTNSPSPPPPRLMPFPSMHLHPSLSSAARHPQTSTPVAPAPPADPSSKTSTAEGGREFEITNRSSHSTYRTTSRPSTASSVDENSDGELDHPTNRHFHSRHHPYQSHHSTQRRPPLSVSPSYSRRASVYSPYSQSHDDMKAFLRASASASANVSADEGSNSNSYYDGDSPVASLSTTSSPIFTFVPGGQTVTSHHTSHRGIPDGSSSASAGRPGIGAGAGSGSGGGGQDTAPLSLDSLPSYPPDQKPPFSYPVLIRLAILGSPQRRLLLSQIYSAIEDKFPWYRDSAPKAWKASVRHCLSLNKEFVRMQRAVEDPGVGCGGWWSVGEGMKGLKRPRKRRPAQSRRPEHELDPTPIIKTPTPSPLAIRRRHSTTFEDAVRAEAYSRYISLLPSSSLPPSAVEAQGGAGSKERGEVLLPPIDDYSLRLPPLHIPHTAHPLPTPPSSSRTVVFGAGREMGETKWEYPQGHSFNSASYGKPRGTHTPTASSSSSYSTQSCGSASSASSNSRPNPMSISSLLNKRDPSTSNTVASVVTERLDKMDIDMDVEMETKEPLRQPNHSTSSPSRLPASTLTSVLASASALVQPKQDAQRDVEMRPAKKAKVETPFSSDQTLRPPSPSSTSPQSHGRRSSTPVATAPTPKQPERSPTPGAAPVEQRHREHRLRHRDRDRQAEGVPRPHGHGGDARHSEAKPASRPPSRSRAHAERTAPARPTRPPPPVPASSSSKGSTAPREKERKGTKSGRNVKSAAKSTAASKPWASSMDLSLMEPESE